MMREIPQHTGYTTSIITKSYYQESRAVELFEDVPDNIEAPNEATRRGLYYSGEGGRY